VTCYSIRTELPDVRTEFFVENVKGTPRPIVTAHSYRERARSDRRYPANIFLDI